MIDVSEFLGPLEVIAALLVGLQAGATYAWHQRLGTRLYHSLVLSGMFFLAMVIVRSLDGSQTWQIWFAGWSLYMIFAIGLSLGYRGRQAWENRQVGRSKAGQGADSIAYKTGEN